MAANSKYKYLAFYDLDHTILEDNSATHLVHEARRRGIMTRKHFRHAIWLSILYKLGIGDSTKMIIRMLGWLKGLNEAAIKKLCVEVFEEQIVHRIRQDILETVEDHRKKGGSVVLLSSASEPICIPVSTYLAMDDVICTRLEAVDGLLTGRTIGKLVYGKEKEHRLLNYCAEKGFDPSTAYYYGDSHTDQHVMSSVGHPVAVDPDKRLLRIAQKRNWPIMARNRS
jgi:HAD superfamily hydrolase (TIGR01490 family)